jgi:hypothetical protein
MVGLLFLVTLALLAQVALQGVARTAGERFPWRRSLLRLATVAGLALGATLLGLTRQSALGPLRSTAQLPAPGTTIHIDVSRTAHVLAGMEAGEAAEQLRDWAVYGTLARGGFGGNVLAGTTAGILPVRLGDLVEASALERGRGRWVSADEDGQPVMLLFYERGDPCPPQTLAELAGKVPPSLAGVDTFEIFEVVPRIEEAKIEVTRKPSVPKATLRPSLHGALDAPPVDNRLAQGSLLDAPWVAALEATFDSSIAVAGWKPGGRGGSRSAPKSRPPSRSPGGYSPKDRSAGDDRPGRPRGHGDDDLRPGRSRGAAGDEHGPSRGRGSSGSAPESDSRAPRSHVEQGKARVGRLAVTTYSSGTTSSTVLESVFDGKPVGRFRAHVAHNNVRLAWQHAEREKDQAEDIAGLGALRSLANDGERFERSTWIKSTQADPAELGRLLDDERARVVKVGRGALEKGDAPRALRLFDLLHENAGMTPEARIAAALAHIEIGAPQRAAVVLADVEQAHVARQASPTLQRLREAGLPEAEIADLVRGKGVSQPTGTLRLEIDKARPVLLLVVDRRRMGTPIEPGSRRKLALEQVSGEPSLRREVAIFVHDAVSINRVDLQASGEALVGQLVVSPAVTWREVDVPLSEYTPELLAVEKEEQRYHPVSPSRPGRSGDLDKRRRRVFVVAPCRPEDPQCTPPKSSPPALAAACAPPAP